MPPRVTAIIGMGRAGSSLLARVLNLLGMDLGPPDQIMGPAISNPRGHWEYVPFVEINDAILATFGGSWDEPPMVPDDWFGAEVLAELRQRARQIIDDDFSHSENWGWKDPRASITLPFWQDLIPSMQYIICLRDPLSVAESLQVRDGYTLEKGGRLWMTYVSHAIVHSTGAPRMFVYYEDLLETWRERARDLASFLGMDPQAIPNQTMEAIGDFITSDLRHHGHSLTETLGSDQIPYGAQALHLALRTLSDADLWPGATESAHLDAAPSAFDVFGLRTLSNHALADRASRRTDKLARDLALAEKSIATLRSELQVQEETTEQLRAHAQGIERSVSWRITSPLRHLKSILVTLLGRE